MPIALIVNSIVSVLGVVCGLLLAAGSVISIANMKVPWASVLLVMAFLIPLNFALSGVGAWVANARGSHTLIIGLIVFPWIFAAAFVALMLLSFGR